MTRSLWRVASRIGAAALVVLPVAAMSSAAQAATGPGWRVEHVFGADSGASDISAVSRSDVWVAGISGVATESVLVERWNGRAWRAISVPKRFTGLRFGDLDSVSISGASATSALVLVELSNDGSNPVQYGLVWHGHAWSTTKLASGLLNQVVGAVDLSSSNMWVFVLASHPYALRYNGKGWMRSPLPRYPTGLIAASSASDILLAGSTANPLAPRPRPGGLLGMHWNGKAWRTQRLPDKVRAPRGGTAVIAGFLGLGRSSLAFATFPAPCCGGELGPPGITVAAWTGRSWRVLAEDTLDRVNGPVISDGHGGLWISGEVDTTGPTNIVHYSAGKFTRQELRVGGAIVQFLAMSLIGRTRSVWAVGGTSKAALILRYVI